MLPSASARRSSRYVRLGRVLEKVLAVRFEPDAGVLGCSPVFVVGVQLPEPLTGNLWTLDDFKGNLALLVRHSSSPPEFFSSPVMDHGKCASLLYCCLFLSCLSIRTNYSTPNRARCSLLA